MVQDHRWLAQRRQRAGNFAHEGVELGPAGFRHGEVAEPVGQRLELRGVARTGGAIQVEEAADVDVPRLAGVEAVKHLDLHARKEMRQVVARRQHGQRLPRTHLRHGQQAFALDQVRGPGAVEKPGRLAATGADRLLHRAQDGQRITLGSVQEIALGVSHQRSISCLWSRLAARATESGLCTIS